MRDARRHDGSTYIPLAIAGLPSTDDEKKYVRQATMMLRYRLWAGQGPPVEPIDGPSAK
jgi:hypothetical protein